MSSGLAPEHELGRLTMARHIRQFTCLRHRITTNHDTDCDNPSGRDHQDLQPFQAAGA